MMSRPRAVIQGSKLRNVTGLIVRGEIALLNSFCSPYKTTNISNTNIRLKQISLPHTHVMLWYPDIVN
jgi:hypothetical protein